jgi:hypothetical protein
MNYYKITVKFKTKNDDLIMEETHRNFENDTEAFVYASGFADGLITISYGVLLEKQIDKLNDDRRV